MKIRLNYLFILLTVNVMAVYSQDHNSKIIDISNIEDLSVSKLPEVIFINSDRNQISIQGNEISMKNIEVHFGDRKQLTITYYGTKSSDTTIKVFVFANHLKKIDGRFVSKLEFNDCMDQDEALVYFSAIDVLKLNSTNKKTKLSMNATGKLITVKSFREENVYETIDKSRPTNNM